MKKLKFILIICLSLLMFTSCGKTNNVENKKYSITFEENGGTQVEDIYDIEKGSTVVLPSITRIGYTFEGWYTSKIFINGTEITNNTAIGKDIKVYAKWKALSYKININLDGGTMDSKYTDGNNNINYGVEISLPMPTKEGYLFENWFLDGKTFDGKLTVTGDANISAKWIDINTLQPSYKMTLHLDGGALYKYNSKEKLMEEFLDDFSSFIKRKTDSTNFWNYSYESIIGFFNDKQYRTKWMFLVEYLSTTAREENREFLKKIKDASNISYNELDVIRAVVRNEILAFFLNTERVVPGWGALVSGNYAKKELQDGYVNYCKIDAPSEYITGQGIELPEPLKEGYIFLGWYDNAEFTGNVCTEIMSNQYGDFDFYALWGKVE